MIGPIRVKDQFNPRTLRPEGAVGYHLYTPYRQIQIRFEYQIEKYFWEMKSIFVAAMAGGAQALFNQPQDAVCEGAFQYIDGMQVQGKSHICAKVK